MVILQIGSPKSGNFWMYKILKEILIRSNLHSPSFIQQQPIYKIAKNWELNYPVQAEIDVIDITDLQTTYRISSIFKMPIEDLNSYVSKTNRVWTHSPVCKATKKIFSHFDKKIYIIRDPRDRAVSAANYYCSPYMLKYYPQPITNPKEYLEKHLEDLMIEWVWHVFDYIRLQKKLNLHIVYFESFLIDFQRELESLLNYLELALPKNEKQNLENEVSFTILKKSNPKHLKKGTSGYWKNHLSDEQKEKANVITAPLLKVLGYPTLSEKGNFRPSHFFNTNFEILREELIEAQRRVQSPNT